MAKNFDFIGKIEPLKTLYTLCDAAETSQKTDPTGCALNCRKALEYVVNFVFLLKKIDKDGCCNLYERMTKPEFCSYMGKDLLRAAHYIRKAGNAAAHASSPTTKKESFFCLLNLHTVVSNVLKNCGAISELPHFDKALIPSMPSTVITAAIEPKPDADIAEEYNAGGNITAATATADISEAETRRMYIDQMLKEAGWEVMEKKGMIKPHCACVEIQLEGMPNNAQTGYADYVLYGADGKPLAVVEAKRTSVDPLKGEHQAQLYAELIERQYGVKPVIYTTNGFKTEVKDGIYPKHEIYSFHTEKDLEKKIFQRRRSPINAGSIDLDITNREYQIRAIHNATTRYNNKHHRALLVMATGTGKTRTAISLVKVLQQNNWIHHVLFLADRTSLVSQAKRSFVKFMPSTTTTVLNEDKKPDLNAEIMFSTYQTMIGYIDKEAKDFSVGRFDLIIIDEAHRSIFGKYHSIIDYFDSLVLGMTATPRKEIDRNTYDLFECENDEHTFSYELEEAVRDGYLTYFKALDCSTKLMTEGKKYDDLNADEREQMEKVWEYEKEKLEIGAETRYERDIKSSEIFKYLFNTTTIDLVLKRLMNDGLRIDDGEKIGKTIIFAYNHKHAVLIVERFAKLFPELGDDYCQLIDNYVNYAADRLERFYDANQMPQIAVSVDMLDTGIDVPEILNLVFFKKVMSSVKFWQMVGRGTRLCPEIDKKEFYIFDWCGNFQFFKMNPEGARQQNSKTLSQMLFELRIDLLVALQGLAADWDEETEAIYNEIKDILVADVASISLARIDARKSIELITKYSEKENWQSIDAVAAGSLKTDVAPLLLSSSQDIDARRFDYVVYQLEVNRLVPTRNVGNYMAQVMKAAEMLQKKATMPQVKAAMPTIKLVQTNEFWDNAGVIEFERVRKDLRELIQYLDGNVAKKFTISIGDEVTEGSKEIEVIMPQMSYANRVNDFITKNGNNPIFVKIRNIEQLTKEDIEELQHVFWQELGTKEEYEKMAGEKLKDNVAAFIRKTIRVDEKAALKLFAEFICVNQLSPKQEDFLKALITLLNQRGDVEPEILFDRFLDHFKPMELFGDKTRLITKYVEMLHTAIAA